MTFDSELTLISTTIPENDIGDAIQVDENRFDVLCNVESITRSEHYAAAAHGLKPEIVFVINKLDYNRQSEVEYEGVRYRVMRHYAPKKSKGISDFDTIELICTGLVGD